MQAALSEPQQTSDRQRVQHLVKSKLKRGVQRCSISAKGQSVHGDATVFGCHQFSKKFAKDRQKKAKKQTVT